MTEQVANLLRQKAYKIQIAALEREKGELEKYAGALLAMGTALSR